MYLLIVLFAMGGAYNGPIKRVLSPLPISSLKVNKIEEPVFIPVQPLPIENELLFKNDPIWRYETDEESSPKNDKNAEIKAIEAKFQGTSFTGWIPPDVQVAAGSIYVGEIVNSSIEFYSRTGAQAYSVTLYSFFSSLSPSNNFIFDPKIAYDGIQGHWIVLALQLNSADSESNYFLAVSQTPDPLLNWYFYSLDATLDGSTQTDNWADYPGLGFNDWGIFITSNQFQWSGSWQEAKLRVLDKTAAYNGTLSGWYDFGVTSNSSSWKPAQCMSPTQTEFILRSYWGGSSTLRGWKVTGSPTSPTLSSRYDISVQYYGLPPGAQQMGTDTTLDSGDARIQDVTYKDSNIYASLTESNPSDTSYCASRYLMLDSSFAVQEDISYGDSGFNYIYPRVAVSDSCIAMVFTRCGPGEYAGVRYTKKAPGATPFEPSTSLKDGEGPYVNLDGSGRNRWGDYSGAYVDPDHNTIWLCGEYANSSNLWGTWIAQVSISPYTSVGSGSFWFSNSDLDPTPTHGTGNVQVGDTLTLHAWLYVNAPFWQSIGSYTFPILFDTSYLEFLSAGYDTSVIGPPTPYSNAGIHCPSGCDSGSAYLNKILWFARACSSGCFTSDSALYHLGYVKFVVKNSPSRDTGITVIDTTTYPLAYHALMGNEVETEDVIPIWEPFRIASGTEVAERNGPNPVKLLWAVPNPFEKSIRISFSIPDESEVNISIFDVSGRLVRNLLSGVMKEGIYTTEWNGEDTHNRPLSSGTYFVVMKTRDYRAVKRVLLVR